MTKQELIDQVAKKTGEGVSKSALNDIIDTVFATVAVAIKKEKRFSFPSFGTFSVRSRKARTGRNPRTGETIKIKASKTVGFKPAPTLKDIL